MAITPVTTAAQGGKTKEANVAGVAKAVHGVAANTEPTVVAGEAAVYEKSDQTAAHTKAAYTRDTATLSEITRQVDAKLATLRATVENLFSMQSVKKGEAQGLTYYQIMEKYDGKLKEFYQNLEVDEDTRLTAQQEVSEDGFWGVKKTSERAIEFAKALSGGDPSKIELLKGAIEEGYKAAEKAWGGELPEICRQTQAATLKGLDDWAAEAKQSEQTA
ncbi:hypothetical protein SOV_08650 [Sporomusa ovata DSM 2662]|uniref:Uncharacterized protein n=1 Tax=Sporomusa ovata TaxID=2378 RepID=A0A0U1L7K6_9FIRM|nr:hypothetical protein [Sporomusa ovata]EQB28514.1 hypothetical protein SOV_1c02030 [Sporomusa ovata DSM 2662]CQR74844.1 hypothetical protein SpAn4DRAFT_4201 [Sporomusa ovata]